MLIRPDLLLRLEALLVSFAAVLCFAKLHGNWLLFVILLLVPDLSLLGYLTEHNERFAAVFYNLVHSYAAPIVVALVAWKLHAIAGEWVATIWIAHIALDRFLGFGLKYAQAPQPTHIQVVRFYQPS